MFLQSGPKIDKKFSRACGAIESRNRTWSLSLRASRLCGLLRTAWWLGGRSFLQRRNASAFRHGGNRSEEARLRSQRFSSNSTQSSLSGATANGCLNATPTSNSEVKPPVRGLNQVALYRGAPTTG